MIKDDIVARLNASVADIQSCGGGNKELDLILSTSAEGAGAINTDPAVVIVIHSLLTFRESQNLRSVFDYLVDKSVLHSVLSAHPVVAFCVSGDDLDGLAGVLRENGVETVAGFEDVLSLDLDVTCLTLCAAEGLVDHNFAVGESESLALGTCGEKESAHGSCHSDADGGYVTLDEVHSVVDSEAGRYRATGAIDVKADVRIGIFRFQIQKLRNNEGCCYVVNLVSEEDDSLVEKAGVNIVRPLTAVCCCTTIGTSAIVLPPII